MEIAITKGDNSKSSLKLMKNRRIRVENTTLLKMQTNETKTYRHMKKRKRKFERVKDATRKKKNLKHALSANNIDKQQLLVLKIRNVEVTKVKNNEEVRCKYVCFENKNTTNIPRDKALCN